MTTVENVENIRELAKAYRANRSRARRLGTTRMSGHYANAGIEAMARTRNQAASDSVFAEMTALQKKIKEYSRGDELITALDAEHAARRDHQFWRDRQQAVLDRARAVNALVKSIEASGK